MSSKTKRNDTNEEEIDLTKLFYVLLEHYKLIICATVLFTVLGFVYALLATPIYKADALVQVEQKISNGLLSDLSSSLTGTGKPQSTTEIELIRSRMILGKTIRDLSLDVAVKESFFPVFGKAWALLTGNLNKNQIALSRFSVPTLWNNTPLILNVIDSENYTLSKDGELVLTGKVGQFEVESGVSILVSEIKADSGTEFEVTKFSELEIIATLLMDLNIVDKGKDTGILELTLLRENPIEAQQILDQISKNYLEQNVARKSEEAAKSLDFLKEQLPEIKRSLDESENKLNRFRQQNDSIDLSLEAKSVLELSVQLEAQLNQLTFKEAEVSKLYTKEHPAYRSLLEKQETLLAEKEKLLEKISFLPSTQQEILSLTRDVQANNEVYMQLLNKQQELSIAQASTIGNVRIIDTALAPTKPVKPKKAFIVAISFLLGFILSSSFIILRTVLRNKIQNTEQLEEIGINVYATIPLSNWQKKQDTLLKRSKNRSRNVRSNQLVSMQSPDDPSTEALRSLRTSLHFAMMEAKNNILVISGCSPEIGKSFVTANLSVLIAEVGKKILLIDGDMRRGYLHELVNVDHKQGLSDYLSGQLSKEQIIYKTEANDNIDFIPRGAVPPNPSELLMHPRFNELLDWAKDKYDIVLIDTPPVLAVTDACIIGQYAGTVMLVVRYEYNTIKEIEHGLRRFEQNNIEVKGTILNGVVKKLNNYYQYGYEYK